MQVILLLLIYHKRAHKMALNLTPGRHGLEGASRFGPQGSACASWAAATITTTLGSRLMSSQ